MRAMAKASGNDPSIRERYGFFLLRAPEELYDYNSDPGGWINLAGDPEYSDILKESRKALLEWMNSSNDPLAGEFQEFIKSD